MNKQDRKEQIEQGKSYMLLLASAAALVIAISFSAKHFIGG